MVDALKVEKPGTVTRDSILSAFAGWCFSKNDPGITKVLRVNVTLHYENIYNNSLLLLGCVKKTLT